MTTCLLAQRAGRILGLWLTLFLLASSSLAGVVINEFLANNGGGLLDEDLQTPDWVELYNNGTSAVNLGGWHLTDNAGNLTKWTFPATNLPAGGYLIVFASGKNRANPGWPLHANFLLNNDSGYLALVQPGGTVEHAYSPTYPHQRQNVSYGLATQTSTTSLIASGAVSRVLVPTSGALGTTWTATAFNDSGWTAGNTPASFAIGFTATNVLTLDFNDRTNVAAGATESGFTSFVIS